MANPFTSIQGPKLGVGTSLAPAALSQPHPSVSPSLQITSTSVSTSLSQTQSLVLSYRRGSSFQGIDPSDQDRYRGSVTSTREVATETNANPPCFTAPEGNYILSEHIDLAHATFHSGGTGASGGTTSNGSSSSGPGGSRRGSVAGGGNAPNISPSYLVGTFLSLVSIRSPDTPSVPGDKGGTSDTQDLKETACFPPKFVEIPISGESSNAHEKILSSLSSSSNLSGTASAGGTGNAGPSSLNVKKSKSFMTKNQSFFVNRIVANEDLAKILARPSASKHRSGSPDGQGVSSPAETSYLLFNIGSSFVWADLSWNPPAPLSVTWFKDAVLTCHDVNLLTRETTSTVIGFNTGDLVYYSAISGKYSRLNKNGNIIKSAVTCVKWVPGSETLFFAGFEDGSILILDKDLEDQNFTIPSAKEPFLISRPPKNSKLNPQAYYKAATKSITCIAFSPDCQHVAITSLDGSMRIVDYMNDISLDLYPSFFGGVFCTAWSPDGKFILTGGQDDLVSVYLFRGRLVLRCQGHSSWVTSLAFDPFVCTDKTYRFGSVGEDAKLCLWDFSIASLRRPKSTVNGTIPRVRSRMIETDRRDVNQSMSSTHEDMTFLHEAAPLSRVSIIEPLTCKRIHAEPLTSIVFHESGIVTADRCGLVRIWSRPTSQTILR